MAEITPAHECTPDCELTAAGRCKVVVSRRNSDFYHRNRQRVLDAAKARRRYERQIIAEYERHQASE